MASSIQGNHLPEAYVYHSSYALLFFYRLSASTNIISKYTLLYFISFLICKKHRMFAFLILFQIILRFWHYTLFYVSNIHSFHCYIILHCMNICHSSIIKLMYSIIVSIYLLGWTLMLWTLLYISSVVYVSVPLFFLIILTQISHCLSYYSLIITYNIKL